MGTTGSKDRADGSRRASNASNSGSSANGAGDAHNAGSMSMRDLEDMEDMPEGATEPEKMSWYTMMKVGYDQVVNSIIRPPRAKYTERDLGPREFDFRGRVFERTDFTVTNPRGMKIVCSHWQPKERFRPAKELPCLIYLHGNSSCRVGCLENLEVVLAEGATLLSFDCTGSGVSDGDYVTLGWYEKDDLAAVITHLRATEMVSTIALWGRSMGAATALLHAHRDPTIAGMILDSPFADLRQLAEEIVEMGKSQTGYRVPGFVIGGAIRLVRSSVLKKTGMDIFNLRPIADVDKSFVPALFVAGDHDHFINPHHSKQIHAKYAGDKNIVIVPGDHNTLRPKFFQDSAGIFLRNVLQIPPEYALDASPRSYHAAGGFGLQAGSLESAWREAAGDESVDSAAAARAASVAAEEAMIQQAVMASLLTATAGGVRATPGKPSVRRQAADTRAQPKPAPVLQGMGSPKHSTSQSSPSEETGDCTMPAAMEAVQSPGNVLSRRADDPAHTFSTALAIGPESIPPPTSPGAVGAPAGPRLLVAQAPTIGSDFLNSFDGMNGILDGPAPSSSTSTRTTGFSDDDDDLRLAIQLSLQAQNAAPPAASPSSSPSSSVASPTGNGKS